MQLCKYLNLVLRCILPPVAMGYQFLKIKCSEFFTDQNDEYSETVSKMAELYMALFHSSPEISNLYG